MLDAGCSVSGVPYLILELVVGVPVTVYANQNRLPVP